MVEATLMSTQDGVFSAHDEIPEIRTDESPVRIVAALVSLLGLSSAELAQGQTLVDQLSAIDRVIVDNVRFYNIAVNNIDPARVTVFKVGEGTPNPGVLFEIDGDGFAIDPCEAGMPVSRGFDLGYFVASVDANTPIEMTRASLYVGYQADGAGVGAEFFGGSVYGSMSYDNAGQSTPTFSGSNQFDTSMQTTPPIRVSQPSPDSSTFAVINVGLEVAARVTTLPIPPEECGIRARITSFEQRVLLGPNTDTDNDGEPDSLDDDDDNDGMLDTFEDQYGFDPLDPADAVADADGDGYSNLEESHAGTDPLDPLSTPSMAIDPARALLPLLQLLLP